MLLNQSEINRALRIKHDFERAHPDIGVKDDHEDYPHNEDNTIMAFWRWYSIKHDIPFDIIVRDICKHIAYLIDRDEMVGLDSPDLPDAIRKHFLDRDFKNLPNAIDYDN